MSSGKPVLLFWKAGLASPSPPLDPYHDRPVTNDLHVESTRDLGALFADTELWNGLADGIPFRETSWLRPWWSVFAAGRDPLVLVARDGTGRGGCKDCSPCIATDTARSATSATAMPVPIAFR